METIQIQLERKGEGFAFRRTTPKSSQIFCILVYVQKCPNCDDANPICLCDSTIFVCLKREKVNWKFLFGKTGDLCSVDFGAFVGHQQVQQATQIHPTDSTPITKANTSSLFYGYYVHDVIFYITCNLDK